jgi:6-O-methylguanine DNA methyltransferase, DNA binding domain
LVGRQQSGGWAQRFNPVGIVVPFHRLIGANGSLPGHGGGIERKAWLLEHEASAPTMNPKRPLPQRCFVNLCGAGFVAFKSASAYE